MDLPESASSHSFRDPATISLGTLLIGWGHSELPVFRNQGVLNISVLLVIQTTPGMINLK